MHEGYIHNRYNQLERQISEQRLQRSLNAAKQSTFYAKSPADRTNVGGTFSPRWRDRSFRSKYFDVGLGLISIIPGETRAVAQWNVARNDSGVWESFSQNLNGVSATDVTWSLRINGLPIHGFPDFSEQLSTPQIPRRVNQHLIGTDTVGNAVSDASTPNNQVPTLQFLATNNSGVTIQISGRIQGWTFPIDEQVDDFYSF